MKKAGFGKRLGAAAPGSDLGGEDGKMLNGGGHNNGNLDKSMSILGSTGRSPSILSFAGGGGRIDGQGFIKASLSNLFQTAGFSGTLGRKKVCKKLLLLV